MAVNFDLIWAKYILLKLKAYLKNCNVYFKSHIFILLNFVQQKKMQIIYTSITLLYVILNHFQNKSYMHQSQYMYFTKNILTNNHNRLKIDK